MDTSEEYIKMCDCPEIQYTKTYSGRDGHSYHIYFPNLKPGEKFKSIGWLPRQDEIQEMLLNDGDYMQWALGVDEEESPFELLFYRIMKNLPLTKFNSGEQLWLAFYMLEKHKKTWDGKKWGG